MSTPRRITFGLVFLISILVGAGGVLAAGALSRFSAESAKPAVVQIPVHRVTAGIDLSAQLQPASIAALHGYRTIIDLRPDGEASDEPRAAEMEQAARAAGLSFRYVPVPHGEIPQSAVDGLRSALDAQEGPVLLYCRSGKRAARTWALVEASRPAGMSADEIIETVHRTGQDASDLRGRIDALIAARAIAKGAS